MSLFRVKITRQPDEPGVAWTRGVTSDKAGAQAKAKYHMVPII